MAEGNLPPESFMSPLAHVRSERGRFSCCSSFLVARARTTQNVRGCELQELRTPRPRTEGLQPAAGETGSGRVRGGLQVRPSIQASRKKSSSFDVAAE
jgi:hypothetical protein